MPALDAISLVASLIAIVLSTITLVDLRRRR